MKVARRRENEKTRRYERGWRRRSRGAFPRERARAVETEAGRSEIPASAHRNRGVVVTGRKPGIIDLTVHLYFRTPSRRLAGSSEPRRVTFRRFAFSPLSSFSFSKSSPRVPRARGLFPLFSRLNQNSKPAFSLLSSLSEIRSNATFPDARVKRYARCDVYHLYFAIFLLSSRSFI